MVYFLKTVQIYKLGQCTFILYIGYTNRDTYILWTFTATPVHYTAHPEAPSAPTGRGPD